MKEATFDPARRLDLYFRCNRAGSKDFILTYSDGSPYSFIYEEFEFNIYRYEGEKKVFLQLLSFSNQDTFTAQITKAQSNIDEAEYYYEIYNVQTEETWLCGNAIFHNGKFDGVSTDTTGVTIQINGDVINITLEVTPASGGGGGGSGTVTSVGALSQLFTTSNPTTTPTFTAINQNANTIYAGPATGAAAVPTFRALVAADLPSDSGSYWKTIGTSTLTGNVLIDAAGHNVAIVGNTGDLRFDDAFNYFETIYITANSELWLGTNEAGNIRFIGGGGLGYPVIETLNDPHGIEYESEYPIGAFRKTLTHVAYVLGAKTYDGTQTFLSSGLELNNPANTFQYIFAGAAILADRTVTMPLLASNDTFVTQAFTQTLTNKTISGASNTITNVSLTTGVTGILPTANGGTGVANNAASTLTISGNFATTLTVTATTGVTLPTTGTLATLAGAEILTNKTLSTGTVFSVIPTINDGIKFTFNPDATTAGANAGAIAGNPSALVDGDFWYNSTAFNFGLRLAGTTYQPLVATAAGLTNGRVPFVVTQGQSRVTDSANFTFVTNRILGTTLYLTVSAGTATAGTGPLKMTSSGAGVTGLLGTAEAGVFEFTDRGLWFSPAASTRHKVLHGLVAAAAPATNAIGVIVDYFGTSATRTLNTPNTWISVVGDDGNTYKIPGYS